MSSDIQPFLTYVRSEYLYALKEGFGYFTPATVFAISSYANDKLKFQILADDKTMFNDIPSCALVNSKEAPKLEDDGFENCPDEYIAVIQHEHLLNINVCGIWKRDHSFWQKGIYILTVEWPKAKQQVHLVELENGNYVFWSNKYMTWGNDIPEKLPIYPI